MISTRYGVLLFFQGPGMAELLSNTRYFSAHSDTLISSGGRRYSRAFFWYWVTRYLRMRHLGFGIFALRFFGHASDHESLKQALDFVLDHLVEPPCA